MPAQKRHKIFALVIRVLMLPPVMAALLVLALRLGMGAFPGYRLLVVLASLSVLPVLSYPVCALIPRLRRGGRKTQRALAVAFSVLGYLGGFLFSLFTPSPSLERMVYLTYLLSGMMIALSPLVGLKVSGHGSAIAGPVAMLTYCYSPWWLLGSLLALPVLWASRVMGRHSLLEFLLGCATSVLSMLIALGIFP